MKRFLKIIYILSVICGITACSNIECPLNNTALSTYGFYQSGTTNKYKLIDTITVKIPRNPKSLYNRAIGINTFDLPVSFTLETDTLLFHISNSNGQVTDTIFMNHTNKPHFESLECGTVFFHEVKSIHWTNHDKTVMPLTIDSIIIANPYINYEQTEHFKIYFSRK